MWVRHVNSNIASAWFPAPPILFIRLYQLVSDYNSSIYSLKLAAEENSSLNRVLTVLVGPGQHQGLLSKAQGPVCLVSARPSHAMYCVLQSHWPLHFLNTQHDSKHWTHVFSDESRVKQFRLQQPVFLRCKEKVEKGQILHLRRFHPLRRVTNILWKCTVMTPVHFG